MPNRPNSTIENNFTKGFVTEFTGLNFPENAATETDNCHYTLIGNVERRLGIDYESNYTNTVIDRAGRAINQYKWNNAGTGGSTQIVVEAIGEFVYFYISSNATRILPLSSNLLTSINIRQFAAVSFDTTLECQFADGNGYLFIFHPSCSPIYCSYTGSTIAVSPLDIQIRDFQGVLEPGIPIDLRPTVQTDQHYYNTINQGWISGNVWSANSTTAMTIATGSKAFTVPAGLVGVVVSSSVSVVYTGPLNTNIGIGTTPNANTTVMSGTITAYAGTTMTISVTSVNTASFPPATTAAGQSWTIYPAVTGNYLSSFQAALGVYPSNSDVWWRFKNASGVFDPTTTVTNRTINTGPAPKGHFVLNAFSQSRSAASGVLMTDVTVSSRPRTGAWFAGRIWYSGVDGQQIATGDAATYSWTENLYFSQVVVDSSYLGKCYQTNDPTSEDLFGLLPTDGGVVVLQGCGSIYKLFTIANGMLVFAANGIWFITGSQGIGFTASDYTVTKISDIRSISGSSYVNVSGLPYFWNEDGIYAVQPGKDGSLTVEPITLSTIASFYDEIPLQSKKYVKGAYDPINYVIQWVYRAVDENSNPIGTFYSTTARYEYTNVLNYNTYNKAFYPYSLGNASVANETQNQFLTKPKVNGILYVSYPGGLNSPTPAFKYFTSTFNLTVYNFTFSDEHSTDYLDFKSFNLTGWDYNSYFITGYKLRGQAQRRFQIPYIYMFSDSEVATSYRIQGLWDYATDRNSGRWSVSQLINNWAPKFGVLFRRHRIRGQGIVLQIKITSVSGQPFNIIGWSSFETVNSNP